ncbi:MAG: rRNA pseudouridine synthase [Nitrospira sp.]|nr:rRNA pseudouridine synthase [Nitrospira sp.]
MEERLQKIIARAGITSRRKAEELILEGRVKVNGRVVTELGSKADAEQDHIKVDGKLIHLKQPQTYLMLNKPRGYVTTLSDPEGRLTVMDLLKGVRQRVFPVGRLDYDTEGLLLLTNDGNLAHGLMHPSYEVPKTYLAKVKGVLKDEEIKKLEKGVPLLDGKTAPCTIKKIRKTQENSWLEVTLHEGKKRQVRRMLEKINHPVLKLKRIRYAFLGLAGLLPGQYRHLSSQEVKRLKSLTKQSNNLVQ